MQVLMSATLDRAYLASAILAALLAAVCGGVARAEMRTEHLTSQTGIELIVTYDPALLAHGYEYTFTLNDACRTFQDIGQADHADSISSIALLRVSDDGKLSLSEPRVVEFKLLPGLLLNYHRLSNGLYIYQGSFHQNAYGRWSSTYLTIRPHGGGFVDVKQFAESLQEISDATVHDVAVVPGLGFIVMRYPYQTQGARKLIGGAVEIHDPLKGDLLWRWESNIDLDGDPTAASLPGPFNDYMHLNSVEWEPSRSSFLVSSRTTSTILEISYPEGKVINRINCKNWTCIGDPRGGWLHQHDVRLSADGKFLTLFDNANELGEPKRPSRGVKYQIDFANKRLTFVSEIAAQGPLPYRYLEGGYYTVSDGTIVMGWGIIDVSTCNAVAYKPAPPEDPLFSHLDPSGRVMLQVSAPAGWSTYRAYGYRLDEPW